MGRRIGMGASMACAGGGVGARWRGLRAVR